LAHEVAVELIHRHARKSWTLYEDTFYRRIEGLVGQRVGLCAGRGLKLTKLSPPSVGSEAIKRQAVLCYRSQLRALSTPGRPGYDDAFAPESFWRVCL
jgi:hypothetical protein